MGKSSEWVTGANRRYVISADDVPELERESAVNEFVQKRPREEAESAAYTSYRRKHHVQAAAHHLAMMKAAAASGSHKDAKKHSLVYGLHLKELGFDPNDSRVPDEIQSIMSDPEKNPGLRFQAHKGDAFLLNKSEEPIYIQPEWSLSDIRLDPKALLAPPPMVKKEIGPVAKSDGSPIQVNFLTNKLRQLRDWFDQQGISSIHEKDLPLELRQQLMRVGREHGGIFLRDKIQQAIDSAPPRDYNFSTGTYETAVGATQRHSKENSNVFRLDMTPEQEKQMRDAGVLDAYMRMHGLSQQSGHPVGPGTLGWVRWTGDKSGVHIDEVQSDYGRPWPSFFADQFDRLVREGRLTPAQAQQHLSHYNSQLPEEQRKLIQKIAFGNKHPSEVLHEGFHQWARTHGGLTGAPIHVWQPEAKAYMTMIDPQAMGRYDIHRAIPGHLQTAYRDIPVDKQGMVEGQYGEIPTQSNKKLQKQPPKKVVGKVGDETVQWRPSTKTYKDVVRGKEKTVEKAEVAEKLLELVKASREKLAPAVKVKEIRQRGNKASVVTQIKDDKGKAATIESPFEPKTKEEVAKAIEMVKKLREGLKKSTHSDVYNHHAYIRAAFEAERSGASKEEAHKKGIEAYNQSAEEGYSMVDGEPLCHCGASGCRKFRDHRGSLTKGDVLQFPVARAQAATVPPTERAGEVNQIKQNDPHDQIRRMHESFHKMPLPELEETLRFYHRTPGSDSEKQIAYHVYKARTQPGQLNKGMLGAMSNAGVNPSPRGAASGQPVPPPGFKDMSAPPGKLNALTPQSTLKPGGLGPIATANSKPVAGAPQPGAFKAEKPYTGRDEGIRTQKLAPGTPGANKQGVGIRTDKKKAASKEAARKYRPGREE